MPQRDPEIELSPDDFPYASWERVYQEHDLYALPWDSPEPHPLLVDLFKNHRAKPGVRALDLGCGTGASSRLLAKVGYEVDAWDVSETAIARARTLSKDCLDTVRFIAGNAITNALHCSDSYDLVLDFFFLHHVQPNDIEAYFSGMRRVLNADGIYVVGVFVHDGKPLCRPSLYSSGDVTYWSRSELETRLGGNWRYDSAVYGRGGNEDMNYPMGLFNFSHLRSTF